MQLDPGNNVIKLCAEGMEMEGRGNFEEAAILFRKAWEEATNDFEKLMAAHYVARHQKSVADKLNWDQAALNLALKLDDETIKGMYPSLYLSIAKCYEDLEDLNNARKNYESALSFANFLPDDAYGNMIKTGIKMGIKRVT